MSDPLAFHITWTTYGSWLPGDSRGWVKKGEIGIQPGDAKRHARTEDGQAEATLLLTEEQRQIVADTIRDHCKFRGWTLHAINVRTNHVHVVVTADRNPDDVMSQFKAWCSRRLKHTDPQRQRWWTKGGSTKWINTDAYFQSAIRYVEEGQ